MIALLLCLVSIVHADPAVAGPVADLAEEADLHFRLGVDAYRRGDWSGALEHLLLSNRLAPNRNVVFNIARAYEQMGRYSEAFRHYVDYLALETDLERRASAEQALARIRPRVAVLRVESDPPGATIYVDRKELGPRGSTPRLLALDPGPHTVLLEAPGFEPMALCRLGKLTAPQPRAVPPAMQILSASMESAASAPNGN
jgi:tetratricopeptide (TPR) repeat protein